MAPDRMWWFLAGTVGLNLCSAFLFPMFVTDAFSVATFVIAAVPVVWGFALLFCYRSKREHGVTWLALIATFYWLLPVIGLPIEFLGR